jgi:diguanylate cyclase (GGDEF)-like protein
VQHALNRHAAFVLDRLGCLVAVSDHAEKLLELDLSSRLGDTPLSFATPRDRARMQHLISAVLSGQAASLGVRAAQITHELPSGEPLPLLLEYQPVFDTAGQIALHLFVLHRELALEQALGQIEVLEREIERLRALSLIDDLTGVLNRRGFVIHAEQCIRVANRNGEHLSVLFIDVDGLKRVNDLHGHAAGDRLIRESAALLRHILRESDIIGRVGGDEFAVVALGCTPQRLPELLARIRTQVESHNAEPGCPSSVSLSVGSVVYDPSAPEPMEALLARADAEMYARKRAKRGACG